MLQIYNKTENEINQKLIDDMAPGYQTTVGFPLGDFFLAITKTIKSLFDGLANILSMIDIDNLAGDDLTRWCKQRRNIIRKPATYASGQLSLTGTFTVNIGDLFESEGGIQYKAIENLTNTGLLNVECLTPGIAGNVGAGAITKMPVTIAGVSAITNNEAFTNGYEEEADNSLRQRYYDDLAMPITSGNIYHYMKWAKETTGVGSAKIIPLWNGDNTVKVIIIDSNMQPASAPLVSTVQNYIDPSSLGQGLGQAPIGAYCTVVSATALNINITANIIYMAGTVKATVDAAINQAITDYLKSIAFVASSVSYAKIGAAILDTEGVQDYNNLLVNTGTSNIAIDNEKVAIKGTVTLTAV